MEWLWRRGGGKAGASRFGTAGAAAGLLTTLGLTAGGSALAAQPTSAETPPPPTERFGEAIDVRIINLEVQVRDRDGRPVVGLPADAFRVAVGGVEVPIAHFEEIADRRLTDPLGLRGEPIEELPDTRSSYLFFLDDELNLKTRRDFVLRFLRGELDRIQPGDRAAVVAFDGRKLEVLTQWTESIAELDDTLARAMTRPADGIVHLARRRMPGWVANWEGNAARRSVLAAASALHSLPAPPGRRVLVLVAGSWDPIELSRADRFASWCVADTCDGLLILRVLTDTANLLDYSIVAVDVEGRDVDLNWEREKRLHEVLRWVAGETGGEVLLNGKRKAMLQHASRAGFSYYSLAVYPPPEAGPDRLAVQVLVDGDLTAHARRTFVNLEGEKQEELEVLNQLLFRHSGEGSFPLTIGQPETRPAGWAHVPFSVAVPLDRLTWLPDGDEFVARYEIQVATQDGRDNSSEVERHAFEARLDRPARPGDFDFQDLAVSVRRRKQTLSVVVRDRQGDESLSVVLPFEPRPKRAARAAARGS